LTDAGLELFDTYVGATEVLTGSARLARESEDAAAAAARTVELTRKEEERARRRRALERQIEDLREQLQADDAAVEKEIQEGVRTREQLVAQRGAMARSRQAFAPRNGESRRRSGP
jgi:hypothetical protein